ncbi:hypothetical protein MNB_SUP05-10-445 [hydrothermal vent metagenome]|uniref:Uncharacterized protein n=1 Tax=hydrothermal vent metagenome TaxID=652676 RepID=A0A1W1DBM0_9ZZZZ
MFSNKGFSPNCMVILAVEIIIVGQIYKKQHYPLITIKAQLLAIAFRV